MVGAKDLVRVGQNVHPVVNRIEVKVGGDGLSLGCSFDDFLVASGNNLHHRLDY